jgi:hypothetical protein
MSDLAARHLAELRNSDGGFGPAPRVASEPEPTALAAIALDDADAAAWLAAAQQDDGGFLVGPPDVRNHSATPLAAIALGQGAARERTLDYLVANQAPRSEDSDPRFPHDPSTRGWGWTSTTFGWVEPTARALLALKLLRPDAADAIADGTRVLEDRECSAGGWNYGNRQVLGRDLEPFLQTTAAATLAIHNGPSELRDRGAAVIARLWPDEPGGLGWAMSLAALRLSSESTGIWVADADALAAALETLVAETDLLSDTVALGWAAIAMGDALERLRISR